MSSCVEIAACARASALSRAQVGEVSRLLSAFHPHVRLIPLWLQTIGDIDLTTSLRAMDKSDFFTREIDAAQQRGECRISIHSAKDLPAPLPQGLALIALTQCLDPSDVLVLPQGKSLEDLPPGAVIGTSAERRESAVQMLREDLVCKEIRGSVLSRLEQLDSGEYAGVVVAEAAILRLQLTHRHRLPLPGETAPLQGQLAVLGLEGDEAMRALFSCIDTRDAHEDDSLSRHRSYLV